MSELLTALAGFVVGVVAGVAAARVASRDTGRRALEALKRVAGSEGR